MGGGGYCAKPAAALSARQHRKLVDAYASPVSYGDFDFGVLPDIGSLPPVDDTFDTGTFGFDDAGFDWSEPPAPAAPFGSLAVDALFTNPPPAAVAPSSRALPSPIQATAPGSAPPSPLRPAAVAATKAPAVPVVRSSPILTSYASTELDDVVLVRAPKRPAERPSSPPQAARAWAASDDSDDDSAILAEDLAAHVAPLIAEPLTCQSEVEAALPEMKTQQSTHDGELVTLSPTLWRSNSPPFRIHINAGLRTMRVAEAEAPTTFFGSLHPRIITTGVPHRRLGRAGGGRLVRCEALAPPLTRSTRSHGPAERTLSSGDLGVTLRREKVATDHPTCTLQEVWLLRRSGRKGEPGVLGSHRCDGPFDGTTLPSSVDWPGTVVIDIAAKVEAAGTGAFWIKACGRVPLSFDEMCS